MRANQGRSLRPLAGVPAEGGTRPGVYAGLPGGTYDILSGPFTGLLLVGQRFRGAASPNRSPVNGAGQETGSRAVLLPGVNAGPSTAVGGKGRKRPCKPGRRAEGRGRRAEGGGRRAESGVALHYPLSTIHSPLSTLHYPLSTLHYPLSTIHYPLSPLPSSRRGVLLLIVLALLAIFALVGVAFVVVTSQAQRGAKAIERIDQGTNPSQPLPAQKLLQQAIMQVLHGPPTDAYGNPNPGSVMGARDLLDDMYGNNWVSGTLSGANQVAGFPQLVSGTVSGLAYPPTTANPNGVPVPNVAAELARRGGCVLTITNRYTKNKPAAPNPCYGQSTHIVGITPGATDFQIMAFPDGSVPQANDTFVINGVPFSGTGFGFRADGVPLRNVAAGTVTGCPVALLPNLKIFNRNPPGGANSDYTAADFQHMLLAAQGTTTGATGATVVQTLPSMHRPALCHYWANKAAGPLDFTAGGTATLVAAAQGIPPELMRDIVMRPLPEDNPDFTGSNPAYTGTGGSASYYQSGFNPCWDGKDTFGQTPPPFSWDVDNDGDGVPDSIWIDLGFPVQTTSDGRMYKPLFAILCVDLDGRLNLNADGSLAQTDPGYAAGTATTPIGGFFVGSTSTGAGGTTSLPANYPRGTGFGPAEINLSGILRANYARLFTGNSADKIQGRYGSAGVLGSSNNLAYLNDWFEYGQNNGYGANYWNFSNVDNAGSFGSPPDLFGAGQWGSIRLAGRSTWAWTMALITSVSAAPCNIIRRTS